MKTQEQKDLLLKDLCARLPYGVMAKFGDSNPTKITNIIQCIDSNSWFVESEDESGGMCCPINNVKPYLFPIESMTDEQTSEFMNIQLGYPSVDWFNKNHFDYRGLIPMGLAEDATGLNIY